MIALVVGGLVALLGAEYLQSQRWKWIAKPAASLGFVLLGVQYAPTLLPALLLAFVGDVLLIGKDKRMFVGGLLAFIFAHVAFAIHFALAGVSGIQAIIGLAFMYVVSRQVLRWLMPHVQPALKGPVSAYFMAISFMVAFAFGYYRAGGHWAVLLGAACFAMSDIAAARNRFVKAEFQNKAWGLPLYYGGQVLIVLGFAQ